IPGQKPEYDKFAGAVDTYTIESIMQDGKALQSATSHYLGQNFSKAVNMTFQDRDGNLRHTYTTSWGISTRIIGGLIMSHSDDDGLNLPSVVAPYHIVIIPLIRSPSMKNDIMEYCDSIKGVLCQTIRVLIDNKDTQPQNKKWDYVRKGVPLILEIGQKEVDDDVVCITRRTTLAKESMSKNEFIGHIHDLIAQHDAILQQRCEESCRQRMNDSVKTIDEMIEFFETHGSGIVMAKFNPSVTDVSLLDKIAVSIRCIPTQQSHTDGKCIITGTNTNVDAIFAKSY
ncbi:MAG: hypothetical protein LBD43_02565, partial [Holosporales bacterium]|nr:hypothetical protein [Holosporales bacterium]